ncbi:MAG: asparagine synthase (glutamine-hydrolyzing) [Acidobacteria bacterium]|nr:asparagine synthase (glutamine-hydrolyzing) [Acidobacteriota bacterium]
MCGIAGLVAPAGEIDPDVVPRMVSSMRHRGPDDSGVQRIPAGTAECWLGNARLAIIDLSAAGHMPMRESGSANWITFNGEVYNFQSLRKDLDEGPASYASRTDTEITLKLYRTHGAAGLTRLRGMFAFAVWDDQRRELLLARDRVGKKPLYYATPRPGLFVFASEIRTLLASGLVERRLDPDSLDVYLANGFVVSPLTMLRGVRSLLPGHFMRVDAQGRIVENAPYWRPPRALGPEGARPRDGGEALRHEFREAVRLRMISDVPLGVFLSGGMDSSAVLGALGPESADLRTFSITFDEKDHDESAYSRRVAAHWKTRHEESLVREAEFLEWLPDALASMDQPTFDGVNTYLVSRAARRAGLKVAISGIGADELFGGYPFFKGVPALGALVGAAGPAAGWIRRAVRALTAGDGAASKLTYSWSALDTLGAASNGSGSPETRAIAAYQAAQILFPSWSRRRLIAPAARATGADSAPSLLGLPPEFVAFLKEEIGGSDAVTATSLLTWRLFLGERCLRDTDTMSMGVSLEVRAPFTDHVFVEEAMRVPGRLRCAGPPDKPFERDVLSPFLAGAWEPRAKQGFVLPYRHWLRAGAVRARMRETLLDSPLVARAGLERAEVARLLEAQSAAPHQVPWSRTWAVFALVDWCRRTEVTL